MKRSTIYRNRRAWKKKSQTVCAVNVGTPHLRHMIYGKPTHSHKLNNSETQTNTLNGYYEVKRVLSHGSYGGMKTERLLPTLF